MSGKMPFTELELGCIMWGGWKDCYYMHETCRKSFEMVHENPQTS